MGIAWDPFGDGKTAIRIGAGIAKDFVPQTFVKNQSSVSPFRLTIIRSGITLDNPWVNYPGGNPYPFFFNKENPVFGSYGSYLPVPPNLKTMQQYTWNAGIQRQVTPKLYAAATYLGSQMVHVWNAVELNPAQFLGLSTIFQARSGSPLNIVIGTDVALNGYNGTQRPNQVLANVYGDRSSLTNYFNPAAFAYPRRATMEMSVTIVSSVLDSGSGIRAYPENSGSRKDNGWKFGLKHSTLPIACVAAIPA